MEAADNLKMLDADHPNGPNWKRSEAAEKMRQQRLRALWELLDQQKQKQS